MTSNEFIGKCINDLTTNGVTVQFNKRKNNSKNGSNFFDADKPILVINYYNDEDSQSMFEIFIHEYCHFLQWKENKEQWKILDKYFEQFQDWLDGERKTCSIDVLRTIQSVELDCDKRSIQLIKKYKLPVNINEYIKQSNSYVLSYNLIYKFRKFYNFSAYAHDDILKLMKQKHITEKQLDVLPDGYEEIFVKYSE